MERLAPTEALRRALVGRQPLLYLVTSDEDRALRMLEPFRAKLVRDTTLPVASWSCVSGWSDEPADRRTTVPEEAIGRVARLTTPGFFVMHDLDAFLDRPEVKRALREAYVELRGKDNACVVGARVSFTAGGQRQTRFAKGGGSYASANDSP